MEGDNGVPTASEVLDVIAQYPTLDEVFRRDPQAVSQEDFEAVVVGSFRRQRAAFHVAQEKKAVKKSGGNSEEIADVEAS